MSNTRSRGDWQGMNWIRQEKRLAIYLRDGCACAWCGAAIDDEGTILSLDHIKPHSKGGTNDASNLVTACKRCNDSRQARSMRSFAQAVAQYIDSNVTTDDIIAHIRKCILRPLMIEEARAMVARRGSAAAVLKHGRMS